MDSSLATVQNLFSKTIQSLPPHLTSLLASPTARGLATLVLAYGVVQQFNRTLSSYVVNNWSSDRYDWSREIVLLTGGSSGIGQAVARDLASRGIKVCVADVQEPSDPLRTRCFPT